MDSLTATRPAPRPGPAAEPIFATGEPSTRWVAAIAAGTVLARLPFLTRPMGSDEGGLLLIASQWRPGPSLYGAYWVDRPPLLLDVFVLADRLGGLIALRVIGLALVVASVLISARIARLVGGSPRAASLTAAIFLVNPLFGVHNINGELIATPFVLGAIALAVGAARSRAGAMVVAAGVAGAAAALIKQNEVDGLLFIAVAAATFLATRRYRGWQVVGLAATGAGLATAVVLLQASLSGTGPRALWEPVVSFRLDAARLIGSSAAATTTDRLHGVLLALLASGAPLIAVTLLRRLARAPAPGALDLRWPCLAVLGWEAFSVAGGGSYWLHYLICLVPGLVLVTCVVTATPRGARLAPLTIPLVVCCLSAATAIAVVLAQPGPSRTDPVITWLREHRVAGQTGVVAFGHPDYLKASGLTSPYEELWSLPVRVRDPELRQLGAVLESSGRPDWVITNGSGSLSGWGIDAHRAQTVFDSHYRLAADLGIRRIYLDRNDVLAIPSKHQEPS